MKLLIIRFSSIGDIVLTTPVIRCIKKQLPDEEIHYLTKISFQNILAANPYIDRLHFLQEDWNEMVAQLRQEHFDYVIDLHHNARTLRLKQALNLPSDSFPKLNIEKWMMVNFKWNRLPDISIVDRYFETVKQFGIKNDFAGLDYFIPESEHLHESDIPTSHLAGFIVLVIGGTYFTKRMPPQKLKAICERINHPIILLGGKEDQSNGEIIAAEDPIKIYNACGKFSVNESADLIRRSKLVISHDTGLMHIAAAFKKDIISIWGNTIPEFGMYPYYGDNHLTNNISKRFDIIENKTLSCRPCSKIGYDACPRRHFKCMNELDIDLIIGKVESRLRKSYL
jgi:ADP-heptose:LPS heptosyltransferase